MEFPTIINRTSLFAFNVLLGSIFHVYSILNKTLCKTPCKQTVALFANWLVLLLYVPSQQLWSLRDGQFT